MERRRGIVWPSSWRRSGRIIMFGLPVMYPVVLYLSATEYLEEENWSLTVLSLGAFVATVASIGYTLYLSASYCRGWPKAIECLSVADGTKSSVVGKESVLARSALISVGVAAVPLFMLLPWVSFGLPGASTYGIERMQSRLIALSIPAFIIGLWFLVRSILAICRIHRRMLIALTEEGVLYRDVAGSFFVSWRRLESVRPGVIGQVHPLGTLARVADPESGRSSRIQRFMRVPKSIHGGRVTVNPIVPYAAICFYLRHAELRHELGTPAAAARITPEGMDEVIQEIESHGVVRREYFTTNR